MKHFEMKTACSSNGGAFFCACLKSAFTLVEIMIVIAIISIMSAVALPNFFRYRAQSRTQACISNMSQLQTAAESWRTTQPNPLSVPAVSDIVGTETDKFIRVPVESFHCPEGPEYEIGTIDDRIIAVTCGFGNDHIYQ